MTRKHSRRTVLKKAAYVAPAVLSLQAMSAVAKAGSEKPTSYKKQPKRK